MQQAQNQVAPAAPKPAPAAQVAALGNSSDDALEEAAKAVTAKRTRDPLLDSIRKVRDAYAQLSPRERLSVHDLVGRLFVYDEQITDGDAEPAPEGERAYETNDQG